jgi:hypothetical protein
MRRTRRSDQSETSASCALAQLGDASTCHSLSPLSSALSFTQIAATEDNPLLGTWRLVVQESPLQHPGPPPQPQMRTL